MDHKLLVETTGPHILLHPQGQTVYHNRPTVVPDHQWVMVELGKNHLTILRRLPDDANDQEWAKWWKECDGDRELAIESYASSLAT